MAQLIETNLDFTYTIVEDRGPGKPIRVAGEMQLADVKNANGRIYSEALWNRVLNDDRTQRRVNERRMLGELDHPSDGKTKLRRASHVFTKIEARPSQRSKYAGKTAIYGEYETLPTPEGRILEALLRANVGLGVSSRGDGDVEEREGATHVIPESFTLETFDVVIDPSVDVSISPVKESVERRCTVFSSKATESIIDAVSSILESGNYSSSDLDSYHEILESLNRTGVDANHQSKLETALSLSASPSKEVDPMKANGTTTGGQVTEQVAQHAFESMVAERTASLSEQVSELRQKLNAAESLLKESMIRIRDYAIRNDRLGGVEEAYSTLETRHAAAKSIIEAMQEELQGLIGEAEARQAAESLLMTVLSKINRTKKESYIDRLIAKDPPKVQEALKPQLMRCKNRREVNESIRSFRTVLTENSRRVRPGGRVDSESPLVEATDPNKISRPAGTTSSFLNEEQKHQVEMARRMTSRQRS